MNDFFTANTAPSGLATPPWVEPETPSAPAPTTACASDGIEINPERRRRDTDLLVEPGADARALARLMRQDIADFVAIAIHDRIAHLTARIAG